MARGISEADYALIRKTPLFSGISKAQFEAILSDGVTKTISRGETLFLQGDPAEALFVVLEGWVKLYRMTPAGDEAVVHVFTDGQSFAEAAAFTGGVYPVSAEAVTDGRLLYIPVARLFDRVRAEPEIGFALLASTSLHLHTLVQQIEALKAQTGAQRVAEFLVGLCKDRDAAGRRTIVLPYDKALIAGRLGMKPESLSRAFQRLRDYGVRIASNKAEIADIDTLRRLVDEERATVRQRHHS
ncbi:CRP-like cAMP-binding protein [Rhodobium orientis]|uniref:Cyclic nucleotide-binding protein n=1 Tax=Rhodobium orientis TaxID=34017 RepID=A0A327JHX8_9HYPH|nr:cyclic nucleotide-binding domain-containing protein [Rhodobium orientis]MBB4305312.1 CRP-like cAMP-binding protein [Rhodobium orientis]MBK5949647.1 cyclic nucleotide-binding protein [Rhodobium orientis]RAI24117.1 cyclic nucleotide-binding protein [Rhodobium orientis]